MNKYGPKAKKYVGKALHDQKHSHKYKNRKQAIAVGLSEAREAGEEVPRE